MTASHSRRRTRPPRHVLASAAALISAIAGIALIIVACSAQQTPPAPSTVAARPSHSAPSSPHHTESRHPAHPGFIPPSPRAAGPVLARSVPTSIDIPAIAVHSALLTLRQNNDGSIQVPPLTRNSEAGWYANSPTPGQLGPSIILGHIDSKAYGPAVFFKLGALQPGNTVTVHRADHTLALFRVDKIAEYAKTAFPTHLVYGNTSHAALRLITCGGTFNPTTHNYRDNIVAYANLISTSHAT